MARIQIGQDTDFNKGDALYFVPSNKDKEIIEQCVVKGILLEYQDVEEPKTDMLYLVTFQNGSEVKVPAETLFASKEAAILQSYKNRHPEEPSVVEPATEEVAAETTNIPASIPNRF